MASVELKNVSKVFRTQESEEIYAVANLNLQVADGELLAIVGPSGCGKTTTLRLIAGLEEPTGGVISFQGISMNDVRPADRDVAMVFQNHALYPHMNVFENMAFGLRLRGVPNEETDFRVRDAATILSLTAVLDRYPATLSGGQRQRVAIGRAIARHAKILLFDEPFSNLDAPLRDQMRMEILRLHKRLSTTIVYVTHDQAEAMRLGQRIAVLKDGVLQQLGGPLTLYNQPANIFVAGFIGSPPMNLFRGRVVAHHDSFLFQENNPGGVATDSRIALPLAPERAERLRHFAEGNIVLGIRAEHIVVFEDSAQGHAVSAMIESIEYTGAHVHLRCHTGAHGFVASVAPNIQCIAGERVSLRFEMEHATFFNPASGAPIV